ncbi:hypothetical protein JGH11_19505 [Dysgonomonas sp. Marseille-P4677]|uniref:hypothetical protein n=1 Tax=Dysgonomonas sp. Marseille-P4677 TaxID=2364790 RepID=UPI001914D98B|nr:hypothetical protein [Dysgonomonas sp. Marseille-P4677]MBK5723058.1 hypothetical protein [Dysgonomonas sp. Marseille-P4677]
MKKVVVFLFFLLCSIISYATPQMGDLLIYKGDTIRIYPFLLDDYLSQSPSKEAFHEKNKGIRLSSTACWRGHQAVFEVKGDSLFLQKVYGIDKQEMDLTVLFDQKEDIFFDWYTGTITNPWNRLIYDHNSGWGGFYEYETDFIIEAGILKYIKKYHNTIKSSIYTEGDTLMRFIKSNQI